MEKQLMVGTVGKAVLLVMVPGAVFFGIAAPVSLIVFMTVCVVILAALAYREAGHDDAVSGTPVVVLAVLAIALLWVTHFLAPSILSALSGM